MNAGDPSRLLIIDDEEKICWMLKQNFVNEGWSVDTATDGESGLNHVKHNTYTAIFLDLMMPDSDGLEILKKIKEDGSEAIVIIITGHASYDTAIQAIKLGAHDYIRKPLAFTEIKATLNKALEHQKLIKENIELRKRLAERKNFEGIIGDSAPIRKVFSLIERCAASDITVLIQGESGTGKELVAKAIHRQSERKKDPFVVVDCASIPENLLQSELFGHASGAFTGAKGARKGFLEEASGGTLFLDEIGEMPLALQSNLLRFVQNREFYRVGSTKKVKVDVRILAATNRNLMDEVEKDRFRLDLYNRLNTITISVPPLRERIDDIPLLAEFFIAKYFNGIQHDFPRLSPEAYAILESYHWPGNIRELENAIRRALVLTDKPILESGFFNFSSQKNNTAFPEIVASSQEILTFKEAKQEIVEAFERKYIRSLLKQSAGNIKKSAERAGLSRPAIHNMIKKYDIDVDVFRNS